jgi:AraC family transcriptional regulator, positive regulator of tynA and feaB
VFAARLWATDASTESDTMISMTTDSVLPRERADFWTDLVSRNVTPMFIEPAGEQPLRGAVQARTIGDLGVAQVCGRGVRAAHTRAQIARTRGHLYAACVHLDGEARINRRGEQIALQKGDVFITDSRQEFTLDLERPWRHLLITLPTQWIDGRVTRPDLLSGAVLHGHPLARLWASHLVSGFMLSGDLSPAAATLFARHSVDLLAQLLEEAYSDEPAPSDAVRAAIFLNACRVITLKFGDPSLTPGQIAQELKVSTRTLARIFAANNETVMQRLFDERIRQAARLLTMPEAFHRSVTEIAFACGFNDASHFGRVFAAKMHMTPSQWRQRKH